MPSNKHFKIIQDCACCTLYLLRGNILTNNFFKKLQHQSHVRQVGVRGGTVSTAAKKCKEKKKNQHFLSVLRNPAPAKPRRRGIWVPAQDLQRCQLSEYVQKGRSKRPSATLTKNPQEFCLCPRVEQSLDLLLVTPLPPPQGIRGGRIRLCSGQLWSSRVTLPQPGEGSHVAPSARPQPSRCSPSRRSDWPRAAGTAPE